MRLRIAQIGTDWQDGVHEPLTGAEEQAAREFINGKLAEWKISEDDPNLNDYISQAWELVPMFNATL